MYVYISDKTDENQKVYKLDTSIINNSMDNIVLTVQNIKIQINLK